MGVWRGTQGGRRRFDMDPRTILPFIIVLAMAIVAVLTVITLLRAAQDVDLNEEDKASKPAEQRIPSLQRSVDSAAGMSFRLDGRALVIRAPDGAPKLGDVQGQKLQVQCGFLSQEGAVLAQARTTWPKKGHRARALLKRRPGQFAQFCALITSESEPPIARAVFRTPTPPPADMPR